MVEEIRLASSEEAQVGIVDMKKVVMQLHCKGALASCLNDDYRRNGWKPITHMTDLSEFAILDQLIQVIYIGSSRFVLLSTLDKAYKYWDVHACTAGNSARWWRGRWSLNDVKTMAGTKLSDELMEAFAEKVKSAFVGGSLKVDGYEPGGDHAPVYLSFDGASTKPMEMTLEPLGDHEAAIFASTTFLAIALQAKERGCDLYPSGYSAPAYTSLLPTSSTNSRPTLTTSSASSKDTETTDGTPSTVPSADDGWKNRDNRPQASSSRRDASPVKRQEVPKSINATAVKRAVKGASLANPNKKARKYQELEFDDD